MSPSKTQQIELRQIKLQLAKDRAEAMKKKAIADATQPLGICSIIAFLLLIGIIAIPTVSVLVLIA